MLLLGQQGVRGGRKGWLGCFSRGVEIAALYAVTSALLNAHGVCEYSHTCHEASDNKFNGQHLTLFHDGNIWVWNGEQSIWGDMFCMLHPPCACLVQDLSLHQRNTVHGDALHPLAGAPDSHELQLFSNSLTVSTAA